MTPQPTWIGVIESIVKVGALILAGFWTVYVFRALDSVKRQTPT